MDAQAWKMKRAKLTVKEYEERANNFERAKIPLGVAVTEQAIRELYDKVAALEKAGESMCEPTEPRPEKRGK